MKPTRIFIWISFLSVSPVWAERGADTVTVNPLQRVVVSEKRSSATVRSSVPVQRIGREEIKNLQALQVADVAKHFSGVNVKDYGGVGGLKTISVRSLGAQHTAVSYDGMMLTDCQTGQIDLGKLSLNQVQSIALVNGQADELQPAKNYASGAVLQIQTLMPELNGRNSQFWDAALKTGSWGLFNPMLSGMFQGEKGWSGSVSSEWMQVDGQYPYLLHYGGEGAQTSREKRKNTDVQAFRLESSLAKATARGGTWKWRGYYYQSERGLPNATTYYYDYASQRLWDKNLFLQGQYQQNLNPYWSLLASARWNWNEQRYLDPDYKDSEGKEENLYRQQESYLSAALRYRPMTALSFSFSTDGYLQGLEADLPDFARPRRWNWLSVLAAKYTQGWFTVSASALSTVIWEQAVHGPAADNYHKISPYASLVVAPFRQEKLRFRFFVKDIFRMPTFNDLYYGKVGSYTLKPEKALQYNVGLTYEKDLASWFPLFQITADGYWNQVEDKIVAIPTKNLFLWSMTNLGKVDIKGVDLTARAHFSLHSGWMLKMSGNYTYQRALDVTSPDPETSEGKTYKHQIPYTPRVAGSGHCSLQFPWGELSYALIYSGKRYALGENIAANRLEPYSDHSLSYRYEYKCGTQILGATLEVLNLANKNYEVVRNFPMPGRSFRITLNYHY